MYPGKRDVDLCHCYDDLQLDLTEINDLRRNLRDKDSNYLSNVFQFEY